MCLRSSTGKEKKKKRVQYYIHRYIVGKGNNKRWKQPIQVKLVIKHKKKKEKKRNVYQSGSVWVQTGISLFVRRPILQNLLFFCVKFFLRWMLQQSELGTLIKRNLYTHTKKITNKHFRQIKLKKFFLFFVVVWFCCLLT